MKILFITHAFNSLSQRLWVELTRLGHEISIEFDIRDSVTIEAVDLFKPDLIIAPYLRRAIPKEVWVNNICLIVHPGPRGDRGPSSLDWAVLGGHDEWGVTVLQADAEMDAGDVWASRTFAVRDAAKGSLYRNEVTDAAVSGVLEAIEKLENGIKPEPLREGEGCWRDLMKQSDRAIDWTKDDTETVLRKIRAADGFPGVRDEVLGLDCFLYDAHRETEMKGEPGTILARHLGAICRATVDGAVWITHLRERRDQEQTFKLPAATVLADRLDGVPVKMGSWHDIHYREEDGVGYLEFPFYNGAMSTDQCRRLREAFEAAAHSPDTKVIALMGGPDFWSNGIHLNTIEAADSPSDESWANINAMDDLCKAVLECTDKLTIAALQGNAGAGGVFLALCADEVIARDGIVMNPHYKNMGNLFGSEYWTYVLPRRVGQDGAAKIMGNRLPIGAAEAKTLGLIDRVIDGRGHAFTGQIRDHAKALAAGATYAVRIAEKRQRRSADEAEKPLSSYREEELNHMKLNFYGFDPSYHVARYNFVFKILHSWTPLHLARHRRVKVE